MPAVRHRPRRDAARDRRGPAADARRRCAASRAWARRSSRGTATRSSPCSRRCRRRTAPRRRGDAARDRRRDCRGCPSGREVAPPERDDRRHPAGRRRSTANSAMSPAGRMPSSISAVVGKWSHALTRARATPSRARPGPRRRRGTSRRATPPTIPAARPRLRVRTARRVVTPAIAHPNSQREHAREREPRRASKSAPTRRPTTHTPERRSRPRGRAMTSAWPGDRRAQVARPARCGSRAAGRGTRGRGRPPRRACRSAAPRPRP